MQNYCFKYQTVYVLVLVLTAVGAPVAAEQSLSA